MHRLRSGFAAGLAAYLLWGLFPLYWPLLEPAGAVEILAHRILWSIVLLAVVLAATQGFEWVRHLGRRKVLLLALAAVLITINWGAFIYGVNSGHVVETSLGYFINPLVTVTLAVTVIGERLRLAQWTAVGIAALAVVVLTVAYGRPPWIALTLAFSFGFYGLVKKQVGVGGTQSLAVETAFLLLPALICVFWLQADGSGTFTSEGPGHALLLGGAGIVTAVPLMLFGAAAVRIPLVTIGLLQYLAPIMHFGIGVGIRGEPMPPSRLAGFVLVWIAIVVFSYDSLRQRRRVPVPVGDTDWYGRPDRVFTMEFRILGPLEVVEHERTLLLGGTKQRSLLAVLLQHPCEVVSTDHLLGELWGDEPPATAAKSIQVYVSRLRKTLGPDRVVTRAPGYALQVDPAELDLARFERLRAAGRVGEALALWRGPPYADLAYEPCVQAERARLEELRLVALEERVDADLEAGRHADLIGELETLIAAHPLRERLRGQLMLALYRSARQAEALESYRAAHRRLSGELGLEPGSALQRLERAILQHDPALDRAPSSAATGGLLVAASALERLDHLVALAEPLGAPLLLTCIVPAAEVGTATAALGSRARALTDARAAAFSSPDPGADLARLAMREGCELLLIDAGPDPLAGAAGGALEHASCDVALLVGGPPRAGPVLVPFGAGRHDWAALELGARIASATGAPLQLIGALSGRNGRDASRLLADASLIVQRQSGVIAEPVLAPRGRKGMLALAAGAGLLIVGFPDSWSEEGLGGVRSQLAAAPPAPTVLIRRGAGRTTPTATRFTWSLT